MGLVFVFHSHHALLRCRGNKLATGQYVRTGARAPQLTGASMAFSSGVHGDWA